MSHHPSAAGDASAPRNAFVNEPFDMRDVVHARSCPWSPSRHGAHVDVVLNDVHIDYIFDEARDDPLPPLEHLDEGLLCCGQRFETFAAYLDHARAHAWG